MNPRWHDLDIGGLTARQMHDLIWLRHRVFVREQECPSYDDLDGLDVAPGTRHLLAEQDGVLLAYARVLAPADHDSSARIGRVVVAPSARGTGLGRQAIGRAVAVCAGRWPTASVALAAQHHLREVYAGFGFTEVGEAYEDQDGIPHVDMVRAPG